MGIFTKAYYAGKRAGRVRTPLIYRADGKKTIAKPYNPYRLNRQFFLRVLWEMGYDEGLRQRLMERKHA